MSNMGFLFQIDLDDISEAYEEMFSVSLSKVIYEKIATGDYRQLLLRILNPERKGKTRKKWENKFFRH